MQITYIKVIAGLCQDDKQEEETKMQYKSRVEAVP